MAQGTRLKDGVVRDLRVQGGLTLRGLAERCEAAGRRISDSQLSKIERGLNRPRPQALKVIADVLGVKVAELMDVAESTR